MGAAAVLMDQPIDRVRVSSYSRAPTDLERDFYRKLIEQLAAARRAATLTQEQLDTRLGVSEGQVAKWESFARLPGAFMLVCWSNALGISLAAVHHS